MNAIAEWCNSLDAIWLRTQILDIIIRIRGHNCQHVGQPFQLYYPVQEGSVHLFDSTAVHYTASNTVPRCGRWRTASEVLEHYAGEIERLSGCLLRKGAEADPPPQDYSRDE